MTNDDIRLAKQMIQLLDFDIRVVYSLSIVEEMSAAEIAKALHLPVHVVEYRLKKAHKIMAQKVQQVVKRYMLMQSEKYENGDQECPWTLALVNLGILNKTEGSQEAMVPEVVSQVLETVNHHATETATTGAGVVTATWSLASVFMVVVFPFAWVMSLLIGTQFCGLAFVKNATSLPMRRWIVQQFFYGYFLLVFLPVIFIPTCYWLNIATGMRMQHTVVIPFLLLGMALTPLTWVAYTITTRSKYSRLMIRQEESPSLSYRFLKNLIGFGFGVSTLILIVFFLHFVWKGILPNFQQELTSPSLRKAYFIGCIVTAMAVLFLYLHISTLFLLRYCLSISRDDAVFHTVPPMRQPIDWVRLRNALEWPCFWGLILFSAFPPVYHFSVKNTRPVCSSAEWAAFTLMWCLVFLFNRKTISVRRWWCLIAGALMFQVGVMAFLRIIVY